MKYIESHSKLPLWLFIVKESCTTYGTIMLVVSFMRLHELGQNLWHLSYYAFPFAIVWPLLIAFKEELKKEI